MASIAFKVSGIVESDESRIYLLDAATLKEIDDAGVEANIPKKFYFPQTVSLDLLGSLDLEHPEIYLQGVEHEGSIMELGVGIDPYGAITISKAWISEYQPIIALDVICFVKDTVYVGTIYYDGVNDELDPIPATAVGDIILFTHEEA